MKNFILIIAGIVVSNFSIAQPAIHSTSETATTPDFMVWLIGAVLVVSFIFLVVLALAKGATAMSESIEISLKNKT